MLEEHASDAEMAQAGVAGGKPLVLSDTLDARIVTPRVSGQSPKYQLAVGMLQLAGGAAKIAATGAKSMWQRAPVCVRATACALIVLVVFVGIVFMLLSAYMPIARWQVDLRCVGADEFQTAFPPVPDDIPEAWRGVLWMDQTGRYGRSDVEGQNATSASLAFSFAVSTWDPSSRTIKIGGRGGKWPWQGRHMGSSWLSANRFMGYEDIYWARFYGYSYTFILNEGYTYAQIIPSFAPLGGWIGTWGIPVGLMNYSMQLQNLTGRPCPPPHNATKDEASRCAKFMRTTRLWDWFPEWSDFIGEYHYPVFEIVKPSGERAQPFYAAYKKYAMRAADPDEAAAFLYLNANLTAMNCTGPGTAIADVR